jgi:hypothetical protein
MSGEWQLMLEGVDPEGEKRAPEGSSSDEWADEADRRTDRLAAVVDAATVSLRTGHVLITDGPFTETKE